MAHVKNDDGTYTVDAETMSALAKAIRDRRETKDEVEVPANPALLPEGEVADLIKRLQREQAEE